LRRRKSLAWRNARLSACRSTCPAADKLLQMFRVACSLHRDGSNGALDLAEIISRQCDAGSADVGGKAPSTVIPGRRKAASYDVQLHIGESITTIGSMDSGLAPRGAPRNDEFSPVGLGPLAAAGSGSIFGRWLSAPPI